MPVALAAAFASGKAGGEAIRSKQPTLQSGLAVSGLGEYSEPEVYYTSGCATYTEFRAEGGVEDDLAVAYR